MELVGPGEYTFAVLTENELRLPFYLVGAGCSWNQDLDPHTRPSGYAYFQWIQVESGEGSVTINGEQRLVCPHQAVFLHPDVPHEYHGAVNPWMVHWFTFGGYHIVDVLNVTGIWESGVYAIAHPEVLQGKIRLALDTLLSSDPMKGIEASALVYDFLISIMKFAHLDGNDSSSHRYRQLDPLFSFIEEQYARPLTINEMANVLDITPQYPCRLFKRLLHQRPIEYLNAFRVSKSKEFLLGNPDLPIGEVARRVGYENAGYFNTVFRRSEGISPGMFRRMYHQAR